MILIYPSHAEFEQTKSIITTQHIVSMQWSLHSKSPSKNITRVSSFTFKRLFLLFKFPYFHHHINTTKQTHNSRSLQSCLSTGFRREELWSTAGDCSVLPLPRVSLLPPPPPPLTIPLFRDLFYPLNLTLA